MRRIDTCASSAMTSGETGREKSARSRSAISSRLLARHDAGGAPQAKHQHKICKASREKPRSQCPALPRPGRGSARARAVSRQQSGGQGGTADAGNTFVYTIVTQMSAGSTSSIRMRDSLSSMQPVMAADARAWAMRLLSSGLMPFPGCTT